MACVKPCSVGSHMDNSSDTVGWRQKGGEVVSGASSDSAPGSLPTLVPPALWPGEKRNIDPVPRPPGKWRREGKCEFRSLPSLFSFWRPQAVTLLPSSVFSLRQPSLRDSASDPQYPSTVILQRWGGTNPAVTTRRFPTSSYALVLD